MAVTMDAPPDEGTPNMTRKLTKTQERILAKMKELAGGGTWERVPTGYGFTIRHDLHQATPAANLCTEEEHARNGFGRWPEPVYKSMVFLTLTHSGILMRTAPAPWVSARDFEVPYWLAEAILSDPDLGHDDGRMLELRRARKAKTP
jgi:hypothetical protein